MNRQINQGFSLIELLITLAIMAIVASVATGLYGDYVLKARCTEARQAVLERSSALAKCKSVYGVYNNNCTINLGDTEGGHFGLSLVRDATTFTVTASATGGATAADNKFCSTITIDHLGVQGGTGESPW